MLTSLVLRRSHAPSHLRACKRLCRPDGRKIGGALLSSSAVDSLRADIASLQNLLEWHESNKDEIKLAARQILKGGTVLTTGIGKSGFVARRMAASLSSVGVPSHFVHGTEWFHGDLGTATANSSVVSMSNSGNTEELSELHSILKDRQVSIITLVGNVERKMAQSADVVVCAKSTDDYLGSVPTRSIVSQEALVNALLSEICVSLGVDKSTFLVNHPGGSIGASGATNR